MVDEENGQNKTTQIPTEELLPVDETTTLSPDGLDDSEVPELPTPLPEDGVEASTESSPATESSPVTEALNTKVPSTESSLIAEEDLTTKSSENDNEKMSSTESSPLPETTESIEETTTPVVLLAGAAEDLRVLETTVIPKEEDFLDDKVVVPPIESNNVDGSGVEPDESNSIFIIKLAKTF